MDRALTQANARAFLLQGALWSIALFGVIRLPWMDQHVISALIAFQERIVQWYAGPPHTNVVVTPSCSGADVMALCIGVMLAFPVAWRRRLTGAVGGAALILVVNAVRLATLCSTTSQTTLIRLHEYVWPAFLALITLAYVAWWMRRQDRDRSGGSSTPRRLIATSAAGLVAYAATMPWVFTSTAIQRVAAWTAASGGLVLASLGATVRTTGVTLATARGTFDVTPECLFTPVLPIYLAAVLAVPMRLAARVAWLTATVPLFFVLGVARLLVLALPAVLASRPTFVAHGFYEFVLGAVLIVATAHVALRRESGSHASTRTTAALATAIATALIAGGAWDTGLISAARVVQHVVPATLVQLTGPADQQGALALLPVTQFALLVGLWLAAAGGRHLARLVASVSLLAASQVALLIVLGALGAVTSRTGLDAPALAIAIRAWTVGAPLVIALACAASIDGTMVGDQAYRRFWDQTGETFPAFTGALSTALYFENEKQLLTGALPGLVGASLLKTDLWDEAKNTRILQWAADQGARVHGIDLSEPIVRSARAAFGARALAPAVADVRRLPFADRSFDAVYSMGTIEHFAETEASVHELARVLKPGGRLILGVPNRYDPFLRPAFVSILSCVGLYAYGLEKSYSRRALRRMLEAAGLDVALETGILFIPGWIRMFDLWCHTRARPLAPVGRALVRPFVWLDGRFPSLRRHGYLLASVGVKVQAGVEYLVDAHDCDPAALRSLSGLRRLFDDVLCDLALSPVTAPSWHVFPGAGGITGVVLLSESHLAIHTYPEARLATINLYCCRGAAAWGWDDQLRRRLGARRVSVRTLGRGGPAVTRRG
jgi:S-adenosylmethionine decarboxylase